MRNLVYTTRRSAHRGVGLHLDCRGLVRGIGNVDEDLDVVFRSSRYLPASSQRHTFLGGGLRLGRFLRAIQVLAVHADTFLRIAKVSKLDAVAVLLETSKQMMWEISVRLQRQGMSHAELPI